MKPTGPYSVHNGKLMRDNATARVEVTPVEARDILNGLADALRDLTDRVDVVLYAGYVGHDRIAKARAALAKAGAQ